MHIRILTTALFSCLALISAGATAATAQPLPAPLADSLSSLRAAEGLPAVPSQGLDQPEAEALAARAGDQTTFLTDARAIEGNAPALGPGYLCSACRSSPLPGPDGTVLREIVSHLGWDARALFETDRSAAMILLDPRLVSLSAASSGQTLSLIARVDPRLPLAAPVVWPRSFADDEVGRLRVLIPAGAPSRLSLEGAGGRLSSGRDFTLQTSVAGGGASVIGPDPQGQLPPVALGAVYRVRIGALPAGSITAKAAGGGRPVIRGLSVRQRAVVLRSLRRAPGQVRRIWAHLGSRIEVTRGNGSCPALASCTDTIGDRFLISLSPEHLAQPDRVLSVTFLHELGHVADRAGLTPASRSRVSRTMRHAGGWRCVINPAVVDAETPRRDWCLSDEEQWADDFARYAVNRPRVDGTYGPQPLLRARQVGRILRSGWAPRLPTLPSPSWTGPGRPRLGG
ncbi:hypothetical protein [Miltoncostaea oceani]|uniref:hypothetical protein n=1 Tax=Miltoncostaea oceani TaxID=2843216 RepID=UPI001C3CBB3B|nr:hypothetical protein [Miltoncostaea oceani]